MFAVLLYDISLLLPAVYADLVPLVGFALAEFLEGLPVARRIHLSTQVAEQSTPEGRLLCLLQNCPTLHKLGQTMARDQRLHADLRCGLQSLEVQQLALSRQEAGRWLEAALERPFAYRLAPGPYPAGSVAVALPFDWEAGRAVFKLPQPQARRWVLEELAVLEGVAERVEGHPLRGLLPPGSFRELSDRLARLLRSELDPAHEQANLAWAAGFYADRVEVPRLLPMSNERLTAMTWVEGRRLDEVTGESLERRLDWARTLVEALVARPFFEKEGRFHADPHAGNLLFLEEGRVGLLDWGGAVELEPGLRDRLSRACLGASLGVTGLVEEALAPWPGAAPRAQWGQEWLEDLLDDLSRRALPPSLLAWRRSLFCLQGVLSELAPELSLSASLWNAGFDQLWREAPYRWFLPLDWRGFGSHLSALDLAEGAFRLVTN